jgi:hypothetical protein
MCPFGRAFNEVHVTCRSCLASTGKCTNPNKKRIAPPPVVNTWNEGKTLYTTLFVHGLNRWNNKNRSHYYAVRKSWEAVLAGTVFLWGRAKGKRLLTVTRTVKNKSHLITDHDNLVGCLKPIKDVLTRQGVFIDDDDVNLTYVITQEVGKEQVAIITVKEIE